MRNEIALDEKEIAEETEELRKAIAGEQISKKEIEALHEEIKVLKRNINVSKAENRNLAKKINKSTKDWVTGFDLMGERILQEFESNKKTLLRMTKQKENKERQLHLMKVLMLETEKSREVDKQRKQTEARGGKTSHEEGL